MNKVTRNTIDADAATIVTVPVASQWLGASIVDGELVVDSLGGYDEDMNNVAQYDVTLRALRVNELEEDVTPGNELVGSATGVLDGDTEPTTLYVMVVPPVTAAP